jgi:argininosuccinate synthase
MIYNGLWFSALHRDLRAFCRIEPAPRRGHGALEVLQGCLDDRGRKSAKSLYQYELATYDKGDSFDQDAAMGFIKLWGLPLQTQAKTQMLSASDESILPQLPGYEEGTGEPDKK